MGSQNSSKRTGTEGIKHPVPRAVVFHMSQDQFVDILAFVQEDVSKDKI